MSDAARAVLRGLGELLVTLGAAVLLFVVYELEVTGLYTQQEQHRLDRELVKTWAAPRSTSPSTTRSTTGHGTPVLSAFHPGDGIARIYLPTLGRDQVHVVVEGVEYADLKQGPGHYPGTALPGELGNLVISGHRTTYGQPFNRLDALRNGDPVVLETATTFFTYVVTGTTVVQPDALGVVLPVPGRSGATPTERLLTLTTCNPKYSARQRLVVRGRLSARLAKVGGAVPPSLRVLLRGRG